MLVTDSEPSLVILLMKIAPELLSTIKSPLGEPSSNLVEEDKLLMNLLRINNFITLLSLSFLNEKIKIPCPLVSTTIAIGSVRSMCSASAAVLNSGSFALYSAVPQTVAKWLSWQVIFTSSYFIFFSF